MKKLSVLHLVTSLGGGAGIAASRLSRALLEQGVESSVLTLDSRTKSESFSKIITQKRLPSKRVFSSLVTFIQSKFLAKHNLLVTPFSISTGVLNNSVLNKFDILHVHSFYNLLSLEDIYQLENLGIPIFITMHDQRLMTGGCHYSFECQKFNSGCTRCPQVRMWGSLAVSESMKKSKVFLKLERTSIITPSQWLAEKVRSSDMFSEIDIRVIRNPIPQIYFDSDPTPRMINSFTIGFSSLDLNNPYKGLNILIKALNILAKSKHAQLINFCLIGNGEIDGLNSSIKINRYSPKSDEEMAEILKNLNLMVIPSIQDNSPSVLSESLAAGIPVIGASVGGITEILKSFHLPQFSPSDEIKLAFEIEKIIVESKYQNSKKQKQLAYSFFSFESVAAEIIKLYKTKLN